MNKTKVPFQVRSRGSGALCVSKQCRPDQASRWLTQRGGGNTDRDVRHTELATLAGI